MNRDRPRGDLRTSETAASGMEGKERNKANNTHKGEKKMEGRYCMVRTYSAGVFAGTVEKRNGKEVLLKDARRMWYWAGAATLSQLATEGTHAPQNCKFPCPVSEVLLTEVIEIIPITDQAKKSISEVPTWQE